jgi:intracellular septation protein
MKFLFDLLPVILFFGAYKLYDIYVATGVAIVATIIQVGLSWVKTKKIEKNQIITLVILIVLGGATILLQNELFIKWKPTIVNWLFGVVFLGSQFIGKKTIAQHLMGNGIELPLSIWVRVNLSWSLFFIFLGFLNLFVAYNFSTDGWVNFKLFGLTGLTMVFVFWQILYISRFAKEPSQDSSQKEE